MSSQTLLGLPNLVATSVYASPAIGFGPDAPLLTAQRMAYVALALIVCSLFILSFQVRNRHVGLRSGSWYMTVGAVVLTSLIALPVVAHFGAIAASYTALGPAPVAPSTATISRYDIAVTVDPAGGTLSGTAVVRLVPPHNVQLTPGEIYFALNPGLQVKQVSIADAAALPDMIAPTSVGISGWTMTSENVSFSTRLGWTHANLRDTAYQRGDPVQFTISFGGHWTLSRDTYSSPPPTLSFGPAISPGSDSVFSYVGQGVAFLEGDGRSGWYPLFWTQQTLSTYDARQAFNSVRIRMPATVQVFCPLAGVNRSTDGSWQQLETHVDGVLPVAFVATLTTPRSVALNGATVYFKGDRPSGDTASAQSMALQQAQALDTWLVPAARSSTRPWIGVIVPFIQSPVAGAGMLFLPETSDTSGTVAFGIFPGAPNATRYRYIAQEVAEAWWQNTVTFSADAPVYLTVPPRSQTPAGSTLLYANPPELFVLLATYSALVLTGNTFGHAVMTTEIAARQAYHDQYHSPDPALVLTHLEHELGSANITTLLQSFILQHHQARATTMNFVAAASVADGRDIGPDAAPYLDPTS